MNLPADSPRFSVVIPAYNQAQFLGDAIQSVLDQTFEDFEILVVDDASPDESAEIVRRFAADPRVHLLRHEVNRGLPAARNTGMRAARGEWIALLDADDYFHPEKLSTHAAFLAQHPEFDITYNARFDLHHSSDEIRAIYRPPEPVELADLLLGFPFSPSDMVLRRDCIQTVGLFDESYRCGGEDLDYPCRLALAGKRFARVDKALNFRRFHAGRRKKRLDCRADDYPRALTRTFEDPRFPAELAHLRPRALASRYLEVACWALIQEEYALGNGMLRKIDTLDPAVFEGDPAPFVRAVLKQSIRDFTADHAAILRRIFANLEAPFDRLRPQRDWAVAQGYLRKGVQEILWGRTEAGAALLEQAKERHAALEPPLLEATVAQLLLIRQEVGEDAAGRALAGLEKTLPLVGTAADLRKLHGIYELNRAFALYRAGQHREVLRALSGVARRSPGKLVNRGAAAIAVKSLLHIGNPLNPRDLAP